MTSKLEKFNNYKNEILNSGLKNSNSKNNLARDQVLSLLDEGTFIELGLFAKNSSQTKNNVPYDGVICGYGQINGRLVYLIAEDSNIVGGSIGEVHSKKICNCQELAMKVGAPIIYLYNTSGLRIEEGIDALEMYGKVIKNSIEASGLIPQISIILGLCAGAASFAPVISDFVFTINDKTKMFVNAPAILSKEGKPKYDDEMVGGAKVHSEITGISHFYTKDYNECFDKVRSLFSYLPQNNIDKTEEIECNDDINRNNDILNSYIENGSYDVKNIIKEIADNNLFFEVQSMYAKNILTGFIRIGGKCIGVVANNKNVLDGKLDIKATNKASKFIRTCDSFNIPILTLVDTDGYVPDIKEEHGGLIKNGAKLFYAYGDSTTAMVSLIIGKAYGSAYVAMCSKGLAADIVFAWPSAEIAVLKFDAAFNILYKNEILKSSDVNKLKNEKKAELDELVLNPYRAAEKGYIDDIIEPKYTRKMLISAFDSLENKHVKKNNKKHGNIPL